MALIYYALLEDGSTITLIEEDFNAIKKMISRNIERGAVLKNGDILKTSAVYYLGSKEEKAEPVIKPKPVTPTRATFKK